MGAKKGVCVRLREAVCRQQIKRQVEQEDMERVGSDGFVVADELFLC